MARGHILPLPHIPSQGPIIPPYESEYMSIPPGPVGGLGPYAQTQGPSQDPGYIKSALGGAGPSTCPFTIDDDDDANQFISDSFRDDDFQQDQLFVVAGCSPCMSMYAPSMYFVDIAPWQACYVCILCITS